MNSKNIFFAVIALAFLSFIYIQFESSANPATDGSGSDGSSERLIASSVQHPDVMFTSSISPNDTSPRISFRLGTSIYYRGLEIIPIKGTLNLEKKYISLEEAMEKEYVRLNETSDVNELSLENKSNHYIFLQSGDIVRGGKQDRTLQYDLIVGPKSKKVPVASFCVESGRWAERGAIEDGDAGAAYFSKSANSLASRDLKVAAKRNKNQGYVWNKVKTTQDKLSDNVSKELDSVVYMANIISPSSLELTLENKDLQKLIKEFEKEFEELDKTNLIGLAYAINGQVFGAEIYNNEIVADLYDKLLSSFITEGIAEMDSIDYAQISTSEWEMFISGNNQELEKNTTENLNDDTKYITQESEQQIRFTTIDRAENDWLHVSVLHLTKEDKQVNDATPSSLFDLRE